MLANRSFEPVEPVTLNADAFRVYYDDPNRDGGTINQVQSTKTPWVVTG